MDVPMICTLVVLTVLVFVIPSGAAAELLPLNCSIKRLPSCYFRYQLSQWAAPDDCDTQWEDDSMIVIARGSVFNKSLVENLTNHYIDLKFCKHHLRHRTDCWETERIVDCNVSCRLFERDDCPPTTNSCPSKSVFFDRLTASLILAVPVVLLLALIIWGAVLKCKRRNYSPQAISYEAPTEQVQIQKQLQPI